MLDDYLPVARILVPNAMLLNVSIQGEFVAERCVAGFTGIDDGFFIFLGFLFKAGTQLKIVRVSLY